MPYTTLFFDLDDTLYPNTSGLWGAIRERISAYIVERLGLPQEEVSELRHAFFQTYGTTLRGLQTHYGVDAEDYLAYVHNLPLEVYISPDPELCTLLLSLPQQKWIFTNADADHARRVLATLGLLECFAGIVDIRAIHFACKPEPEAYQRALEIAGAGSSQAADAAKLLPIPSQCVLFDDSPSNLSAARRIGFYTVLVGTSEANPEADLSISRLKELPQAMPELWSSP